jgi:hypothetical protein
MSWSSLVVHRRMEPKFDWIELNLKQSEIYWILEYFFCDQKFSIKIKISMKISDFKFRWKVLPISSRSKFIQYYNMWSRASLLGVWVGGWKLHSTTMEVLSLWVCAWHEGDTSYKSRFNESKSGVGPRKFPRAFPQKNPGKKSVEGTCESS